VEKVFPMGSPVEKVQNLLPDRVVPHARNAASEKYTGIKFVL
jgi:hypothetical protein